MSDGYNGICKAIAVPLLVSQFHLDPNERMENWRTETGMRFRACQTGRVFLVDFIKSSCNELSKESVPDFVACIVAESDNELCERYRRVHNGKALDPDEFLAAHSEMATRGINQLDALKPQRESPKPNFDKL